MGIRRGVQVGDSGNPLLRGLSPMAGRQDGATPAEGGGIAQSEGRPADKSFPAAASPCPGGTGLVDMERQGAVERHPVRTPLTVAIYRIENHHRSDLICRAMAEGIARCGDTPILLSEKNYQLSDI